MYKPQTCPLCHSVAEGYTKDEKRPFYQCTQCTGIFTPAEFHPESDAEVERYRMHENDINDEGYRKFVSPITQKILSQYAAEHRGLDFGSGTGPVITAVLREHGYNVSSYDPYFDYQPLLLKKQYDYIAVCEVAEHFYHPFEEFVRLYNMLLPNGSLYLMTDVYRGQKIFTDWYYKNDPTHVFFYTEKTFEWIKTNFGFSFLSMSNRLVHLKR